jgi:3-oxoacyl-[acyl-carrier protein] reductase
MQISPEEFSRVLDIACAAGFLGCQVFGAAMGEAGYGRIVNLASLAGRTAAPPRRYASSRPAS